MAPPRKRLRQSAIKASASPIASSPARSSRRFESSDPIETKPVLQSPPNKDGWTPEQETALLTAVIDNKPAGPMKHFRMVAISQAVQSKAQLSMPAADEQIAEQHLAIPGIWDKLRTLYNMDQIWERKLMISGEADADLDAEDFDQEGAPSNQHIEFELPDTEFAQMIYQRRLESRGASPVPSEDELVRPFEGLMQATAPSTPATSVPAALRRGKATKGPIANLVTPSASARSTPARSSRRGRRTTRGASIEDRESEDTGVDPKTEGDTDQQSTSASFPAGTPSTNALTPVAASNSDTPVKRKRGRPPKNRVDSAASTPATAKKGAKPVKVDEGKGVASSSSAAKEKEKKEDESGQETEKEVRRSGRERHPSSLVKG